MGPPLLLLPPLELLLELLLLLELEELELELLLLEELEELELELLLLEELLLVLEPLLELLAVVLSLPPPHATTMKLAQTPNASARTAARLRCRVKNECMCYSSSGRPSDRRVAEN